MHGISFSLGHMTVFNQLSHIIPTSFLFCLDSFSTNVILPFSVCLCVTLFVTSAQQENNGCDTHCGQEYSPICAINDKGETKTFPSECVMKSENCLNKSSKLEPCDHLHQGIVQRN